MQFSDLEVAALRYWEQLDSPMALSCAIKARNGMWEEVLRTKIEPRSYEDPDAFRRDNAALTFLKKNPFVKGSGPKQRESVAKDNWMASEQQCYRANERLARYLPEVGFPADGQIHAEFFSMVREVLWNWLGDPPSDGEIQGRAAHGPGKTFSSLVDDPTVADKFSERPTLTRNAVYYLVDLAGTAWGKEMALRYSSGYEDCVEVIRGDRFTTVPKDALRDRAISIGASINIYFQKGVGSCVRQRLKSRLDWDLNTAADIHRKVALKASVTGEQATIDLSNASDSVSKNLVRVLLGHPVYLTNPPLLERDRARQRSDPNRLKRWLERMEDLRATHTRVDGKWHFLEKFSGMGNGYTFELETIVFAAISSVCLRLKGHAGELGKDLFVFGDDIIVPTDTASLVIDALRFCGFEINKEKSFISGPFRESCGGDYFYGAPVRGFYFKRELNAPDDVFNLHNGSTRLFDLDPRLRAWFPGWVLRRLPVHLREIGGPDRFGDAVLQGVRQRFKWKDGIRWVQIVKWDKPKVIPWRFFTETVRLACHLTTVHVAPFGITSRGSVPGWRVTWTTDS